MPDVPMPRLSDTMEEGTILAWLVEDGAEVTAGEPLVEVESDKASQAVDAEISGTLTILVAVGETAAVGVPIAAIVTAGANLFGGPIAGVVQMITLAAAWGAVFVAVARSPLHATARPAAVVAR